MNKREKAAKPLEAASVPWPAAAGLALAVAGTVLVFSRDSALIFSFPKLLILCAGVWLAAAGLAVSGGRALARTTLDWPLAACLLAMALSLPSSSDRWLGLLGTEAFSYGLWAAAVLAALYWLTVNASAGSESVLLRLALVAYGLAGFYAVLQAAGLDPFRGMPPLPGGRAYSTSGSPVALGEIMTLMLPLAVYWVRSRKSELTGWLCLAAMAGGLLVSVSRGSWLSAAAACGLYLAAEMQQIRQSINPRRLALAGAACVVLGLAFTWTLRRRPLPPGDGGRTLIWRSAWDLFKERPLLGWGANSFRLTSRLKRTAEAVRLSGVKDIPAHAHNDFLHALATTGILGLAAYLWLCAALASAAFRAWRDPERPWAPALACGLLGLFLNMKLNPVPLEAFAGAAFFSGLLADRLPARPAGRAWPLLALAASSASLLLAWRLASADAAKGSALRSLEAGRPDLAVSDLARAIRLDPWEMRYRLDYVNALAMLSSRLEPPTSRNSKVLNEALGAAREGLALHPRHPDAYYGEGIALLNLAYLDLALRGRLGDLEPARRALDRALALDETYVPTLQARRAVAEAQGDAAAASELTRRIAVIKDRPDPMKERIQGSGKADSFTLP